MRIYNLMDKKHCIISISILSALLLIFIFFKVGFFKKHNTMSEHASQTENSIYSSRNISKNPEDFTISTSNSSSVAINPENNSETPAILIQPNEKSTPVSETKDNNEDNTQIRGDLTTTAEPASSKVIVDTPSQVLTSAPTNVSTTSPTPPPTAVATTPTPNTLPSPIESPKPTPVEVTLEELIVNADTVNAERNLKNYKSLIVDFNVQDAYKSEIKKAILNNYNVPDIFIAYEILHKNYGFISELDMLLKNYNIKKSWRVVLKDYLAAIGNFNPYNYPPGYLSFIDTKTNLSLTYDCTIAENVNFRTGIKTEDLLQKRIDGNSWLDINLNLGIVNLGAPIPSIGVNMEEYEKYLSDGKLTKPQVLSGVVLSKLYKLDLDTVINQLKSGLTINDITADYYVAKYTK